MGIFMALSSRWHVSHIYQHHETVPILPSLPGSLALVKPSVVYMPLTKSTFVRGLTWIVDHEVFVIRELYVY
jgi:hypothetical protein